MVTFQWMAEKVNILSAKRTQEQARLTTGSFNHYRINLSFFDVFDLFSLSNIFYLYVNDVVCAYHTLLVAIPYFDYV